MDEGLRDQHPLELGMATLSNIRLISAWLSPCDASPSVFSFRSRSGVLNIWGFSASVCIIRSLKWMLPRFIQLETIYFILQSTEKTSNTQGECVLGTHDASNNGSLTARERWATLLLISLSLIYLGRLFYSWLRRPHWHWRSVSIVVVV